MDFIISRDYVRLRMAQPLAEPLGTVPAGVIGWVITVGPTGALVHWHGKYPPIPVSLSNLEPASLLDLLPLWVHRVGRAFGRGIVATGSFAGGAVIGVLADRLARHLLP